jgi:hypothetical protein
MTEVEWTPKALDLLDGLDSEAQERLVTKLDERRTGPHTDPRPADIDHSVAAIAKAPSDSATPPVSLQGDIEKMQV